MDFEDSQEEAAYRAGARDWLEANAASFVRRNAELKADTPARLKVGKEWQALKAKAGYASITLPREVGGGGGTPLQDVIYRQEEARYNLPTDFFRIGLGMCIPTIVHRGTDAQRQRYAASAIRGDEVWCQLFSEPSAGSDLAGLEDAGDAGG